MTTVYACGVVGLHIMSGFVCMSQDCDHQHVLSLYCLFACAYISVFCVSLHVFRCIVYLHVLILVCFVLAYMYCLFACAYM